MNIELAKKAQSLMNELDGWKSLRHAIYKQCLPEDVVKTKIKEYDKKIVEIQKEIEVL